MTKPPLNQLIEWDGSYDRPVPKGSCVTILRNDGSYLKTTNPYLDWTGVTAYLVHAYPPEDEKTLAQEIVDHIDIDTNHEAGLIPHSTIQLLQRIHAEIVSQERA